ncbi:MAG: helix-hairpin-helix domain-containing protein [Bacteroidota bacterium]
MTQKESIRKLRTIPGVGASIAEDLWDLGIRTVDDLRGKDPERLYQRRCRQQGATIDRCLLYVFRCAVYYAETQRPKPELLLWWNWKDPAPRRRSRISS